jgi:His-Xaa-Ser system protein HxsD
MCDGLDRSTKPLQIAFDSATASIDAIQRAAYRMSERLSLEIHPGEPIACAIYPSGEENTDALLAEFRNEVLDQVLRERIREETAEARNLILALAFSNTGSVPHD